MHSVGNDVYIPFENSVLQEPQLFQNTLLLSTKEASLTELTQTRLVTVCVKRKEEAHVAPMPGGPYGVINRGRYYV